MSMRFTTLKEFTYPHWSVIPAERRKHFKKIDHTQGNINGIISPFLVPTVRTMCIMKLINLFWRKKKKCIKKLIETPFLQISFVMWVCRADGWLGKVTCTPTYGFYTGVQIGPFKKVILDIWGDKHLNLQID